MSCPVAIGALFLGKLRADDLKLSPIQLPRRRYIPPAHPGEEVVVIDRSSGRGYHELVSDGRVSLESRQDTATGRTTILEVELPEEDRETIRELTGYDGTRAIPHYSRRRPRETEDFDNIGFSEQESVLAIPKFGMHTFSIHTLHGRIGAQRSTYQA